MGVSGQHHAPVALLPPVPIVQEAGWAPEPVWTQTIEEKSSAPARDRTPIARSSRIYKKEPVCRKCGLGEETASHIFSECEALGRIRYSVLGPPEFELETINQEPTKPLLDLIRKVGIFDGI
jgi:hypothetical protein